MKAKLIFSALLSFSFYLLSSQVPQGFSYQAVARDVDGYPIANKSLKVRLSILTDTTGFKATGAGVYLWEEEFLNVMTNQFGSFTLALGTGTKVGGSLTSFNLIDWSTGPKFAGVKIANPTTYMNMGTSKIWTVPFAMVADNLSGPVKKLSIAGTTTDYGEALFEVKNKDGLVVFAVYPEGVRINIDNGDPTKGVKGGFAIGGFDKSKSTPQDLFVVTNDSIRAYIDSTGAKAVKGGFAIGSFDRTKGGKEQYLRVTRDSVRIYIDDNPTKAVKGGFAIGGFSTAKGTKQYLRVTMDSTRIFTTDSLKGFGVGNLKSGISQSYLKMSPLNYFIGQESGLKTTPGAGDLGKFNSFMGYQAGYNNINGKKNVFIGHQSGLNNNADFNIFIGNESGKANNSGQYNTFLGYQTGLLNTSGNSNTMLGFQAGKNNQTGFQDTYIGYNSGMGLTANSTGNKNVFVGCASGSFHNSGDNNTFVGFSAGSSNQTGASNIFIGNQAGQAETGSFRLYIDITNTASPLLWGDFQNRRVVVNGNSTNNINSRTLFVNGSAGGTGAWWNDSDLRLKKEVETIRDPMQKVLDLRGVTFYWKDSLNRDNTRHLGFIAQEAKDVIPEVVGHSGASYDMQYAPVTALLVEAFKEQHKQMEEYLKTTDDLMKIVKELITKNSELKNEIESLKSVSLNQNK